MLNNKLQPDYPSQRRPAARDVRARALSLCLRRGEIRITDTHLNPSSSLLALPSVKTGSVDRGSTTCRRAT